MDHLIESLRSAIQENAAEMENFISAFVRIPSENPPGLNYRACCDFLCSALAKFGFDPVVHSLQAPGRDEPALIVQAFLGNAGPTVYFHGHYDVVPAFDPSQFSPVIRNGNMFGRGTADMKAGLGVMLFAAKALRDCGVPIQGRIGLTFVPDEETGGVHGSQLLLYSEILGKDGIAMLTAEPTGGVIWNGSRGAISLRITVNGKPFHVGHHYRGINAFEAMVELTNRLTQHKNKVETRRTTYSIEPEAARNSILLLGGTVSGGANFNVVPGQCIFTVDRRINPEESLETEERELLDVIGRNASNGASIEVEVFQRAPGSASDANSPAAKALTRSAAIVLREEPAFELCPGLLETRFYAQQQIPAFAYGPGLLTVSHGPNEFVNLEKTREYALIYALTAAQLLGTPVVSQPAFPK